jgi:hypothetical protein
MRSTLYILLSSATVADTWQQMATVRVTWRQFARVDDKLRKD